MELSMVREVSCDAGGTGDLKRVGDDSEMIWRWSKDELMDRYEA